MRILIADKLSQQGIELLRQEPSWQVDVKTDLTATQLVNEIQQYDGLLVRSNTQVTADVIKAGQNLKVIGRAGTGVDNIDLEAATTKGIVVMNTPGGNSISVTEHTIGLLLSLARYLPQASSSAKEGKWEKKQFTGFELKDKTVGVVGLGRVGIEVVKRAKAFQMHIVVHDPFVSERLAQDLNIRMVSLDQLFASADIITLHVPLVEATRNLINSNPLLTRFIFQFLPAAVLCFTFAILYMLIPNTKVRWGRGHLGVERGRRAFWGILGVPPKGLAMPRLARLMQLQGKLSDRFQIRHLSY